MSHYVYSLKLQYFCFCDRLLRPDYPQLDARERAIRLTSLPPLTQTVVGARIVLLKRMVLMMGRSSMPCSPSLT
jgi:hypothetical protein